MESSVAVTKTDAEFACESFVRNFSKYADEQLVIYGISIITKAVLDYCIQFNIVGLMDETRAGESIYGKPILAETDVAALGVKKIVIIARVNNINIIFRRIARFCSENGIEVYSVDGTRLPLFAKSHKDFGKYAAISEDILEKKLEVADIVSFDIFDTLLMRYTLYPRDIFHIIGKRCGLSLFYNARVKAEQMRFGQSIERIYDSVAELLGLDGAERARLLETEIKTEKEFILSRERVVSCLKKAQVLGKKVYLVSDMYLPCGILRALLSEKGIDVPTENILVSCDMGKGKADGLFENLRERAGRGRILHIGDNPQADITAALQYGIDDTFLIPSAYQMLLDSPMDGLLEHTEKLSERLVLGRFIAARLRDPFLFGRTDGKLAVDDNDSLGQSFFAPIIMSYIAWLLGQAQRERFDCLLCSARDGWLIKQIIESDARLSALFPKLVYYYTSRKTAMQAILNDESDIKETFHIKYAGSVEDILISRFGLSPNELLSRGDEPEEDYILKHKPQITKKALTTKRNAEKYIESLALPKKAKVGYIDFASSGTNQLGLEAISEFDVKGLYFMRMNQNYFMERKTRLCVNALLEHQNTYQTNNNLVNHYLEIENVLTSYEATVDDFDDDGNPVFAEEKRSPAFFEALREVHGSIIDYCRQFEVELFEDGGGAVAEKLFLYLQEDYCMQRASYFEENYTYDEWFGRVWKM